MRISRTEQCLRGRGCMRISCAHDGRSFALSPLLVLSILCALSHCTARDPDDMGAAFVAGVVSMESFVGAHDTKETEQLEAVVSEWKLFSRSHPNAPRGEHQSLRQRLQGKTNAVHFGTVRLRESNCRQRG